MTAAVFRKEEGPTCAGIIILWWPEVYKSWCEHVCWQRASTHTHRDRGKTSSQVSASKKSVIF